MSCFCEQVRAAADESVRNAGEENKIDNFAHIFAADYDPAPRRHCGIEQTCGTGLGTIAAAGSRFSPANRAGKQSHKLHGANQKVYCS